mmetsp:Transcript_43689/g.102763  ORF Transcript_43689/g.102763 Transcript_43689/m.102763 type:complete len:277 (-) Transcript_43689:1311-2141(-)
MLVEEARSQGDHRLEQNLGLAVVEGSDQGLHPLYQRRFRPLVAEVDGLGEGSGDGGRVEGGDEGVEDCRGSCPHGERRVSQRSTDGWDEDARIVFEGVRVGSDELAEPLHRRQRRLLVVVLEACHKGVHQQRQPRLAALKVTEHDIREALKRILFGAEVTAAGIAHEVVDALEGGVVLLVGLLLADGGRLDAPRRQRLLHHRLLCATRCARRCEYVIPRAVQCPIHRRPKGAAAALPPARGAPPIEEGGACHPRGPSHPHRARHGRGDVERSCRTP